MPSMAAMTEYFFIHMEMFWTGGGAGRGGRPGVCWGMLSIEISETPINFRSSLFFTTFVGEMLRDCGVPALISR